MGQYHRIINVDKAQVIYSFDFGNGQKLMEWSWCKNPMCLAMMNLLAGEWKGDRVYVVGDYADADVFECWTEAYIKAREGYSEDIYSASDDFVHMIPNDKELIKFRDDFENTEEVSVEDFGYRYIYNHNAKVYIDLEHCPLEWAWFGRNGEVMVNSVFPLSLLLDMGNGRGGGDYRGDNADLCGSWCDDVQSIEITQEKLGNDYTEFSPNFTEHELIPYTDAEQFIEREREKQRRWRTDL